MTAPPRRYRSVDALRGLDMLIILGIDVLAYRLADATGAGWAQGLAAMLSHAAWSGLTLYDLVFPLFIFLSGVSLGLTEGRKSGAFMQKRALRRAGILCLLGIAYNFGWDWSPDRFRLPSVLFLIGASGLIATWVAMRAPKAVQRLAVAAALLAALLALQLFVPVPGFGPGVLTPEGSINGLIDRAVLPGRLYGGSFDPEGILSLPAGAAIAIVGTAAGRVLVGAPSAISASGRIGLGGAALIVLGLLLSVAVPPIKKLWTPSFAVLAAGLSALLLAGFVWLFDREKGGHIPLLPAIGANAILAYLGARFLVYPFTWQMSAELDPWTGVFLVLGFLALQLGVLETLHRRRLYLRI